MPNKRITVETSINVPPEKVWEYFTKPEHITKWGSASPDWHTPTAANDVRPGGRFDFRMEAKDGTQGFNFTGTYDEVVPRDWITYTMDDGRKVEISFEKKNVGTHITETFDPENENPLEMQRQGWQAILDNLKAYCESKQ